MSNDLCELFAALEDEQIDPNQLDHLLLISEEDEEDVGIQLRKWHRSGDITRRQWQVVCDFGLSKRSLIDLFGQPGDKR